MRTVLKWIGIILSALLGLMVIVTASLLIYGQVQFRKEVNRSIYQIQADTSPAGLRRGEYLMENVMNCTEACHTGADGRPFIGMYEEIKQGPVAGVFAPPNLTPDEETGLGAWTDAEIVRAIREGIGKDNSSLIIMPSYSYRVLSDADAAAIVGYLRNQEPVHNPVPEMSFNAFAKVLAALGMFGPSPVGEPITSPQTTPPLGTVEHGAYLVALGACRDCHGPQLAGGPIPFGGGDMPPAANLTPAGGLSIWSEDDFITAVSTGVTPSGRNLHPEMPRYRMTEADLKDLYLYIKSIPPAASSN